MAAASVAAPDVFSATEFFPLGIACGEFLITQFLTTQHFADVSGYRINLVFGQRTAESRLICACLA